MIEQRQITDVKRQRAAGAFLIDDHGDRAAFHAVAKADAAAAGQARVSEAFQHPEAIILQSGTRAAP